MAITRRGESTGCTKSSVKFLQSVMVWERWRLWCWPSLFLKSNVNAEVYQQVLEYFMLPTGKEIFGCADSTFQQDLAPTHGTRSTNELTRNHDIEVLPWSANSPDLNPMENLVGLVKRRMSKERPSTQEELKGATRRECNSVTSEDCYSLVSSKPRRIQAVIAANGCCNQLLTILKLL